MPKVKAIAETINHIFFADILVLRLTKNIAAINHEKGIQIKGVSMYLKPITDIAKAIKTTMIFNIIATYSILDTYKLYEQI